jgi:drug/metabolite transporter (DMT)-like permease
MWILFALTSATILASRKIQEKHLVGSAGGALGWMIRVGSGIAAILLWAIFSRDLWGIDNPIVWWILAIIVIFLYPTQIYSYYRAMHELPLSLFGMLAPVVLLSNLFFGWILLDTIPSPFGFFGVMMIVVGIILLFWKHEHKEISISSVLFAITSYSIMWLGGVLDKIALGYMSPFTYTALNQTLSILPALFITFFIASGLQLDFAKKNFKIIAIIGLSQWVGWLAGMWAFSQTPNVGYAVALVNTHAIITTLYGVFILKEKITKKKLIVFACMLVALVSFAFV